MLSYGVSKIGKDRVKDMLEKMNESCVTPHAPQDHMHKDVRPYFLTYLPERLKGAFITFWRVKGEETEEIRLRSEQPIELVTYRNAGFLTRDGRLSANTEDAITIGRDELRAFLARLADFSLYALEEELRRGYVTIAGGHRVGLAGHAVLRDGKVDHLKEIGSLNIRLARARPGVGEPFLPYIWYGGRVAETLIVSPPRAGKTTLLRDLVRILSRGERRFGIPPQRISVIDERSEIAACVDGVPTLDVGPRTDVLDACPKAEGMMMAIRSLAPHVVAVDELGSEEDVRAVEEARRSGVSVLATLHGSSFEEIMRRKSVARLLETGGFERILILSRRRGPLTLEEVYTPGKDGVMLKTRLPAGDAR